MALCRLGFSRRSRCCQFSAGLVKAQRDTQSSEHGVVATVEHIPALSGLCIKRNVWLLCDPDAMQQHGKFSRHGDDGTIAGLLASA